MTNCKYKLRKLSVGLVSVGAMLTVTTVMGDDISQSIIDPQITEVSSGTSATTSESDLYNVVEKTEEQHTFIAYKPEGANVSSETESGQFMEKKASETIISSPEETSSSQPKSRSKRSAESPYEESNLMEVENITVDNKNTELNLKDGNGNKKLIKNRDGEQREIVDISRKVKVDESKNELEVTLTVTPKEIDKGAEVIVLLDTSNKMSEESFKIAKENIEKLVNTLTSSGENNSPNHNSRNSVRLIDFYRNVHDPVELTTENVGDKLNLIRDNSQKDSNWGVDLQGAIHKARKIFGKEKESGKRQHIVLFSQGEATFSYDIKDKNTLSKTTVRETVTSSNSLFPSISFLDSTMSTANLVKDGQKIEKLLTMLGIKRYEDLLDSLASGGNAILGLGSSFLGTSNPLDYITLSDLDTQNLTQEKFNYSTTLGEGYHFRSFYRRESTRVPLEDIVKKALKSKIQKLYQETPNDKMWFDVLGIHKWSNTILKSLGFDQLEEQIVNKVVDYLFYKSNYIYYNHNLSAQAESKMARDEGIIFYSFDVTNPNVNKRSKRLEEKSETEKHNEKFDKYLKEMSENRQFLSDSDNKDNFKDILSEITVTDTFDDNVSFVQDSWKAKNSDENIGYSVKHTPKSTALFFSLFSSSSTPEKLTWTISKDELKNAFETEQPLTLAYKLKVNQDKIKEAMSNTRNKRSTSAENDNSLTTKIISNTISYKINNKTSNSQKLEDVNLTYTKVMVPVPEVDEKVIEPQAPQSPEKPLVEPMMPLQPAIPIVPEDTNNDDLKISGGTSEIDIVEDTGSGIEMGSASGSISTQENTDPIVEITEDTQPGMSGQSEHVTTIEDTKPEKADTIIGGNVIDFTEDSIPDNQYTESGQNSTNESQEIIEDTKPESDTILIGEQSDPIEMTEDTLSNQSGHSNDAAIIEDTKQPEVIMGGQANIVDMVEETQSGMSGFNEATVIEEDTRPKLQFHFENEKPIPAINKAISQTPIARVDNNLPRTGDKDKSEAFFTIAALTVIGATRLLSKKDRKNQID